MTSKKIKEIIAEMFKIKIEEVVPQKRLVEDFGADSLRKVECIMKIEEVFSIEISDDEAKRLVTIEDIINYVERKIGVVN